MITNTKTKLVGFWRHMVWLVQRGKRKDYLILGRQYSLGKSTEYLMGSISSSASVLNFEYFHPLGIVHWAYLFISRLFSILLGDAKTIVSRQLKAKKCGTGKAHVQFRTSEVTQAIIKKVKRRKITEFGQKLSLDSLPISLRTNFDTPTYINKGSIEKFGKNFSQKL